MVAYCLVPRYLSQEVAAWMSSCKHREGGEVDPDVLVGVDEPCMNDASQLLRTDPWCRSTSTRTAHATFSHDGRMRQGPFEVFTLIHGVILGI